MTDERKPRGKLNREAKRDRHVKAAKKEQRSAFKEPKGYARGARVRREKSDG